MLVLAYTFMLGHEVVLGHHFSQDPECHMHNCGDSGEPNNEHGHELCTMNFLPHLISEAPSLIANNDDDEPIVTDFSFDSNLQALGFFRSFLRLPEFQTEFEFPTTPEIRSQRLRGPPAA